MPPLNFCAFCSEQVTKVHPISEVRNIERHIGPLNVDGGASGSICLLLAPSAELRRGLLNEMEYHLNEDLNGR